MVRKTAKVGFSALVLLLIGIAGVAAWGSRDSWLPMADNPSAAQPREDHHAHGKLVSISPQAQANLALDSRPIELTRSPFWQTMAIPGTIVERPGACEFRVTAPAAGVVTEIFIVPGQIVEVGQLLFMLRLTSEKVHTAQTELFKTTQDLTIADEQYQRILGLQGTVPQSQVLDAEYQQRRLRSRAKALRFELTTHGLTTDQIERIAAGQFLTHLEVRFPQPPHAVESGHVHGAVPVRWEVEELTITAGEQVDNGANLCVLAEHRTLYVEGRVYRNEIPLVQRAAENDWPVRLEFVESTADDLVLWSTVPQLTASALAALATPLGQGALTALPALAAETHEPEHDLAILSVGNRADPDSQTAPVYLRLPNRYREYEKNGRIYRNWRYRPAQRVFLRVPVKKFEDVFVLPSAAVVQDGAEKYVFRQNGNAFEPMPVHVLYQDERNAVIAHDGSINIGNYIAHNGAAHLLRALKMQSSAGEHGHHHDH